MNYFETLLEEKGVDLDETFELITPDSVYGSQIMTYGVILESINRTNKAEQKKIKNTLVKIDYKNGDIKHFLRHLGKALTI